MEYSEDADPPLVAPRMVLVGAAGIGRSVCVGPRLRASERERGGRDGTPEERGRSSCERAAEAGLGVGGWRRFPYHSFQSRRQVPTRRDATAYK